MKKLTLILLSLVVLVSCKDERVKPVTPVVPVEPVNTPLESLPKDTGGQHQPVISGSNDSPFGYYLYTPSGYTATGPRFPLLICLHGSGEVGDSQGNPSKLNLVLNVGPAFLIKAGKWNPKYPMIVASPQTSEEWWDPIKLAKFIEFITANYQANPSRIYITGLSMGGSGVYDLISSDSMKFQIAAAVPIVGGGILNERSANKAVGIPLWAFHAKDDLIIPADFDIAIVKANNQLNPKVRAKLTMYPTLNHEVWAETYDGSGMGLEDPAYDPFNMEIYSWMLQYSTSK